MITFSEYQEMIRKRKQGEPLPGIPLHENQIRLQDHASRYVIRVSHPKHTRSREEYSVDDEVKDMRSVYGLFSTVPLNELDRMLEACGFCLGMEWKDIFRIYDHESNVVNGMQVFDGVCLGKKITVDREGNIHEDENGIHCVTIFHYDTKHKERDPQKWDVAADITGKIMTFHQEQRLPAYWTMICQLRPIVVAVNK